MKVPSTCTGCDVDVELEVPEGAGEHWERLVKSLVTLGVLCETCAAAEEKREEAEIAEGLAGRVTERWQTLLRDSRVGEFPPLNWSIVPDDAEAAARAFVAGEVTTLTLTGTVGTGKTTLARWAFAHRLKPTIVQGAVVGRRGAWRRMASYMAALGSDFGSDAKNDCADLAQGGVILGLDDLDKVRPSEYAAEQVFALVDAAIATGAPLIVTTNLELSLLSRKWPQPFGEAIASRLDEGTVVVLDGPDLRDRRNR